MASGFFVLNDSASNFYVTNETTYDIIIATVDIRIVTCVSNSQQIMRISTDMLMVL